MAVRSRLLAAVSVTQDSTVNDLYTVPAGRTAVVRRWSVLNRTATAMFAEFGVRSGGSVTYIARHTALPAGTALEEPLSGLVLGPGDQLVLRRMNDGQNTMAMHVLISGSLLLGEPE